MTWEQIATAERFLEREQGTVRKDWGGRLPIALVFPNRYTVGMSSLALHSLYRLWNDRDDVVCERVFIDLLPPLALESGSPLDYFPIVACTISYEMDYFHVVELLRAAGIPPRAADRDEAQPLLLAGGPAVSANPEPLAPLLDAIVVGEVEPIFAPLTAALAQVTEGREAALEALDQVPGLYLPHRSGRQPVERQCLRDLDAYPTRSAILTPETEFAEMGLIEIARGCGRGCRFCLAGYTYRPARQRSVAHILAQAGDLLAYTDRIGLVSAAVSDHRDIDQLATELRRLGARLSISSLRVDPLSEPLIRALAESGTQTLTIAPEAGSERLRRVIHKTQTAADVLQAVDLAAAYDLAQLKLYFMIGLPTEDQADLEALVDLTLACAERFPRQVTVNITPFVPKAHTPFQRLAQTPAKILKERLAHVERALRRRGIGVKSESPAWAEIQGSLARGDRRLAEALLAVERLSPGRWKRALADAGLSLDKLLAERPSAAPLPWDFVHSGVSPAYLDREAERALDGI
jgi:radical SAM superfamily enzyme YgiQ (UPF0313 family)